MKRKEWRKLIIIEHLLFSRQCILLASRRNTCPHNMSVSVLILQVTMYTLGVNTSSRTQGQGQKQKSDSTGKLLPIAVSWGSGRWLFKPSLILESLCPGCSGPYCAVLPQHQVTGCGMASPENLPSHIIIIFFFLAF